MKTIPEIISNIINENLARMRLSYWSCKKVDVWFKCGINKSYLLGSSYRLIANIRVGLMTHVKSGLEQETEIS